MKALKPRRRVIERIPEARIAHVVPVPDDAGVDQDDPLAVLVYWLCVALGLPAIVAIVAAILVLLAGFPPGGYGYGSRCGPRRGPPVLVSLVVVAALIGDVRPP